MKFEPKEHLPAILVLVLFPLLVALFVGLVMTGRL